MRLSKFIAESVFRVQESDDVSRICFGQCPVAARATTVTRRLGRVGITSLDTDVLMSEAGSAAEPTCFVYVGDQPTFLCS